MDRAQALRELTAPGAPYELVEQEINGRRCRVFATGPQTLRQLYQEARSDLPFLVYEGERLSFTETWARASGLAHALVERYGVRPGDRVALSLRNYPEWMIGFMAATSIGAVAMCMNGWWQADEMAYALADGAPRVLIADDERLTRHAASNSFGQVPRIAVRAPGAADAVAWEQLATPRADPPEVPFGPDDPATMLYTSGSTGHPKGAVSTHRAVLSALLSWEVEGKAAVLTGAAPAPVEGAPQPVVLLGIPLFHVTALHAVFLASFRTQRRIVSMYKWDPARAADLIEAERVTTFVGPPAVTHDLVEHARRTDRDLSSLVLVGGGGASRAPEQVRAIDRAFANAKPNTGWGMTETNAIGAGISGDDYLRRPESSGRAHVVVDLRIVDDGGRVLPPGQRGELQITGPNLMQGYWNRPEANAATFDGPWLRTGDIAYMDAEGFVYITDRIKDLVIRGGENIGCGAVEAALLEHPGVIEASVYGVPDTRLGEELGATVYAIEPVTPEELRAFLAPKLAKFEIPRYVLISPEPLPRIASGKIQKRQVRAEALAKLSLSAASGG